MSISRAIDGELLGGVIYTDFTGESLFCHIASFHNPWVSRDLLWVVFDYPFNQLGVKRIFGRIPETNLAAIGLNQHMGLKTIAVIPGVYKHGVGSRIMCIERADCRFLKIKPRHIRTNLH
jgi:RimJ/RimL family protein N-acetyltransferase